MKKKPAKSRNAAGPRRKSSSPKRTGRPDTRAARVSIFAAELERLRNSLREAEETIEAIRTGQVDALVMRGEGGPQIYSLAGAEHPYRIYVERMQEGAVTVSPNGLVLYCNQRFAEMAGRSLERILGYEIREMIPPEAWARVSPVLGEDGNAIKEETTLGRPDGSALAVGLTASRLPLEGGDVLCLVVSDLTEQQEKSGLRLAKEVAEKASLAKDSFLAALSHELRTPLTPALMAAVALETDASVPEPARRSLAMIRRNVELEARLIDDLLDLTRIAQGKLELRLAPLKLDAVLLRALEICQPDIQAKQQRVDLLLEAREVRLVGDSVRLQQACWNLIRNAVKFTPAGGSITVATGNDGQGIWIRVTDSGIGFEPGAEAKLFHAFEQGGRHITRQFGGLGLGLAITRSIIQSHGGRIEAKSAGRNQGASFTLELPLRRGEASAPAEAPAAPASNGKAHSQRILLVEDHRDTRTNLERLLRMAGHEVHAAETAAEALALAAQHPVDLVISDLGLSDQSGLELMRQLRERYAFPGIAVSGYGMEEDIAQSREAGFARHLTKPIRLDHLKEVVAELGSGRTKNSGA